MINIFLHIACSMIIAVNTRFLLKDRLEGIGRFTYEIVKRMVLDHPEDQFYFLFDRAYDPAFIFAENVTPIVVNPPARHPFLWYWWFEYSVPKVLNRIKADVFFSPDSYCSLRSEVKTAMVLHDIGFEHFPEQVPFIARKYYRYFTPRYAQRADSLIAVSEFTKSDISQQYGIDPSKIEVVYNDGNEVYKPLHSSEQQSVKESFTKGCDYFFYLGAIHERKNVHRIIQAFSKYKESRPSDIQLLLGGRFFWEVGEVKQAYDNSTFKDAIHFLGYIEDEKATKLMASATAFVFPSLFEGFGIPLVEAMKCGTPIITSSVSALPEIAGDAALLVNPESIEEIAIAMRRVIEDERLNQALSEKALKRVESFSWQKSAKKVYNLLQELRIEN